VRAWLCLLKCHALWRINYTHFGTDQYIFKLTLWMTNPNTETRYVIFYVPFPRFFLCCMANTRVKLTKTGHGPHSSTLVCICVVRLLFVFLLFVCKCVLPTGHNPSALINISIIIIIIILIINCSWMEEPQILPIAFPISEDILVQSIQIKLLHKTIIWIVWVLINYVTCVAWWRLDSVISLSYLSSAVLDVYKNKALWSLGLNC
jgi:hypothetical protein